MMLRQVGFDYVSNNMHMKSERKGIENTRSIMAIDEEEVPQIDGSEDEAWRIVDVDEEGSSENC
jgi:hypothetical protein